MTVAKAYLGKKCNAMGYSMSTSLSIVCMNKDGTLKILHLPVLLFSASLYNVDPLV